MTRKREPVNRGFRFDIERVCTGRWQWVLRDQHHDVVCHSTKTFPRQHEAGKDCWRLQDGMGGYVQTFVEGRELKR